MEFFDNAVNKAKEALDIAYKKTEEAVNVQKSKFDVATIESKRAKDFEALGQIYYEAVKDLSDNDPSVAELVAAIKEKNEKIDSLRRDIRSTKNKRICPSCNAEIDKDAVFCSSCGEKVTIESAE